MWQEGVRIFEEAKRARPELFANVEIHGIETPIEEIARKAVALAGREDNRQQTTDQNLSARDLCGIAHRGP